VNLKRAIVAITIVTLLLVGVCAPRPARANTSDAFLYAGVGVGVYLVILFTATYMVYGENDQGLPPVALDRVPPVSEPASVHFAHGCAQHGTSVTLLCW